MKKTALLIIDAQELLLTDRLFSWELFIGSVKKLIAAARDNGIEVIYVRHDDGAGKPLTKGAEGFGIYREFAPEDGEMIFDKTVNSPFRDSGLLPYLREKQIETLIVTGLQTDYCMDATVKCGFEHHFEVIVPAYANSTFDNDFMTAEQTYRFHNEHIWKNRYARCISVDETIELMHDGII